MKAQMKLSKLAIFSLICITTLVAISYAYFISSDNVTNTVAIGDVDIEVREEFTPPKNWDGKECTKIVKIQNKSKAPTLIRVAIVPRWIDNQGNPWPGDTNIVTLNYERNNIISSTGIKPNNKWIDGNDGYYYYNTIVPTGDTTVELLKSVSANIPEELKDRYKDKTLIVDVKAEAVQATKKAHRETWSNVTEDSKLQKMLDSLCNEE